MSSLVTRVLRWGVGRSGLKRATGLHRFYSRSHSFRPRVAFLHQHPESRIHQLYCRDDGSVAVSAIIKDLEDMGIKRTDPRLQASMTQFFEAQDQHNGLMTEQDFKRALAPNLALISHALQRQLVIPDFSQFKEKIGGVYNDVKTNDHGNIAVYIPELAKVEPDLWGVAICTADGQCLDFGDSNTKFTIQSAGKCLNYALALDQLTADVVHKYVGQEQSGTQFNSISLNDKGKPHNPMINSGAIVLCSLLERGKSMSEKIRFVMEAYEELCGGDSAGMSASTYVSEKDTADRNYAIAYLLKERGAFPPDCPPLPEVLDFYFHMCSIEITAKTGAVMAATLANSGVCPTTGHQVLSAEAVKNSLSLMLSCGLYDYSGQWSFSIGLPAKSGVSGCILVVVPNVMGICIFSPRLDRHGNSVRGVHFCKELVQQYGFHHFDLTGWRRHPGKKFPATAHPVLETGQLAEILDSAAHGDVATLQGYFLRGFDLNDCDYDNRTALHLAAAEGQLKVMAFLLGKAKVSHSPVDRMTPLDEAVRAGHDEVVELLKKAGAIQKAAN